MMRLFLILALNMQTTIISYEIYQLSHDELSLGFLGLAEVIPAIGFSLFAGHLVEGKEKKTVLLKVIIGYLLLTFAFGIISVCSHKSLISINTTCLLIYSCTFVGGTLRAFFSPANFSLLGLITPKKHYSNAATWSSTAWQIGAVTGPLIGGLAIANFNYSMSQFWVFIFQVISLVSILKIGKKTIHQKEKQPIGKSLKEGLSFVFNHNIILAALALDMFAVLFGGAVALLPVYASDILKVGEIGFGWLRAAPGIGSIITLILISFFPLKKNPGIKLLICIAGFGITTIIFGISTSFMLSFLMLLLGGLCDGISVVIRGTILQLYTPDNMRGRVAAVNTMFISSSNELGALESGLTAKFMGTKPAVVLGGFLTILVVIFTYYKTPKLKTLKLETNE